MSILIKGKDMPDDCKTCDSCQYDGIMGVCFVYDEKIPDDIHFFLTDAPTVIGIGLLAAQVDGCWCDVSWGRYADIHH